MVRISPARSNTAEWVAQATEVHRGKYTYNDAVYTRATELIEITCPKHGNFWQRATLHKAGAGCQECGKECLGSTQRLTTQQYVANATEQWRDVYDYSEVDYKSSKQKVDIICAKHGMFSMLPSNHVRGENSQGCPRCGDEVRREKLRSTTQSFIAKATSVHEGKYSYERVEYVDDKTPVIVTCSEHNDFLQIPSNHLQGQGCPLCKQCGYHVGKAGHLYILTDGSTTKVGITNRNPKKRVEEVCRSNGPSLDIHTSFYFEDGSKPLSIEREVKAYLSNKYEPVSGIFSGSTECFYDVNVEDLLAFVTPLVSNIQQQQ